MVPPISDAEAAAEAAAEPNVVCAGSTGNRVQVVYARYEGSPDNYSAYLTSFRVWAARVDVIFRESAAETGGVRRPLFATDENCRVTVVRSVIEALPVGHVTDKLKASGLDRTDRKYLVFLDDNPVCGTAGVPQDEQPGPENAANRGGGIAIVGNGCWSDWAAAHELLHTLGGVHNGAPHASGRSHCTDEFDLMCYGDTPDLALLYLCAGPGPFDHDRLFDCNHDDYFHTDPAPGSYLATHWNTADNVFLSKGSQSSWAYVHANLPTEPSYTPRADRSFNSSGATNSVTRTAVGTYTCGSVK